MNLSRVSKKVPHEDNRMTLVAIHENKMQEFDEYYSKLPEKEKLLEQLSRKYRGLRNTSTNEAYSLRKQIKELEVEIQDMRERTDESEYLLKASDYLQEYKKRTVEEDSDKESDKDKDILGKQFSFIEISKKSNKGEISRKYRQECLSDGLSLGTNVNKKENVELICPDCGVEKVINHKEALAICMECGETVEYQDNEICTEFSEEIEVLSQFSYKRLNHFRETISMFLARESSSPPQEVIDKLLLELKKDRITNRKDVTKKRIRGYLRKLGLNKMYEHIPAIIHTIAGIGPPKISRALEDKLISMFEEVQIPFEKFKPRKVDGSLKRKNFLSYSYILYKFCQLLGQDQLLDSFSLLKSREKLYEQDLIWKKICKELNWKFHPSL